MHGAFLTDVDWSSANVDVLKTKWADGFSASQIAAEIGCTRSAIIGKVHRLKLTRDALGARQEQRFRMYGTREMPAARAPQPSRAKRSRTAGYVSIHHKPEPAAVVSLDIAALSLDPLHLTFLELRQHHCKYPFGEMPYTFCGLDRLHQSPYCIGHSRICYSPRKN